ncbi:hypothetical protein [Embleya sp. AB8]|uniref:hypothetical protein n=1 Tax=Embleya sp. AB8 TaxID=3156304 RepID=UPI003C75B16D
MSDAGAVRAFRMATHREGEVEPRLVAMRDFLANASDAEVVRNRGLIESQLQAVATQQPETAARMLADVLGRDPQGRYPRGVDAVLRGWVVQPGNGFADTWTTLERALANGPRPLERALLDVLGELDPRAPVRHWRVAATERVLACLEERFAQPSRHPDHELWRLLPVVAPFGAPIAHADWVCVLGDRAAARGDEAEARTCYRLAFEQGCAVAAPRLAHRLAIEGHRELVDGDPARAVRFLYEAAMLDRDHAEYRDLHRAAVAVRDGGPAVGARPGPAVALVLEAAELLDRGDDMGAVRLLRRGLRALGADGARPGGGDGSNAAGSERAGPAGGNGARPAGGEGTGPRRDGGSRPGGVDGSGFVGGDGSGGAGRDRTVLGDAPGSGSGGGIGGSGGGFGGSGLGRGGGRRAEHQAYADTWPARLLLGAVEGDDVLVAGAARDLLERFGDGWARRTPLGPGLVLHRVTRADPELAAALLDALPAELRTGRLGRAVGTAAAYRILASGVRALGAGRPDLARARADLAERLLAGDEACTGVARPVGEAGETTT